MKLIVLLFSNVCIEMMFEFASSKLVRPHKWRQFTGFASPFFNQGLLCLH